MVAAMTIDPPTGQASTADLIRPIITRIYGDGSMPRALADHLAVMIDAYKPSPDALEDGDREREIMLTCWNWFSGGGTAGVVAKAIEAALNEAGQAA